MDVSTDLIVASQNLLNDNPELYERTFPDHDHRNARFVHDLVRRFATFGAQEAGRQVRLLDIGAGTGRDLAHLHELGYRVRGIDISAQMVAHIRRRHPQLPVTVGDARTVDCAEHVDVLICLGSTLLYLHRSVELVAALRRFAACLRPGGLLITEMRNGAFLLTDRGRRELLDEEHVRVVEWNGIRYTSKARMHVDLAAQLLCRRRVWTWPGCEAALEQHTAWRLLFPEELRHLLDGAGFDVVALFDSPGPLTEPAWRPDASLNHTLEGDRLHLVARRRPDA